MSDILVEGPSPWPQDKQPPEKKKRRAGVAWWWSLVFLAMAALVAVPIWYAETHTKKPAPAVAASEAPAAPAQPAAAQPQQTQEPVKQPEQPEEPVKTHAEKQKVENAFFFRIDGKDKQGNPATFDFIVLTDEYTWAKGSTTDVVSADKVIPQEEVAGRVLSPQVRASLESASDLIGVGLASQEGERAQEEARAADRAKTVVEWIKKVSKPEMTLWTLTLGQYDKACKHQEDADTSFERPVMFAGVRSKAGEANLQEALADAVSGHDNLPSRDCYSRFDMEKIQ